ncbi:flagellar motor protein MotB [Vulgatibacter sp.]|uniref:flagellar motor protein MotB n=1 Tax=Vulgatibacter sp. TaxID=1971226 RepID=UPI00356A7FA2
MGRRKKHHHEEHENHERWLVSYADFITLLFAFFVVMYAVSSVDNQRLVQVSNAIRFAMHFEGTGGIDKLPIFQGPPTGGSMGVTGTGSGGLTGVEKARAQKLRAKLEKELRPVLRDQDGAAVLLDAEGRRLTVRLSAARFFESGEALLHPAAMAVLDALAAELAPTGLPIRVEGHTDDRPTGGGRFRNNWDLSAARASTVVTYLEAAHGVPGARLAAVGHGASRPVATNESEGGRDANRRVDLVLELTPGSALEALAP